jgi:murein DD-endopeptidase MepM/ murein hydrolase activator NlpD
VAAPSDPSNRNLDRPADDEPVRRSLGRLADSVVGTSADVREAEQREKGDVPIEQLSSEPPPIVEPARDESAKPAVVHMGRVVDPDVADERPVKHMGRVVDPDVADERPVKHMGRVVDPDVADESPVDHVRRAEPNVPDPRPVKHMGRIVDPDVAEEGDLPIEQMSSEPPPIVERKRRRQSVPDEPSLRPYTAQPMPSSEDLLDPDNEPPPIPRHQPRVASTSVLSPRMTAVFGALFGLAGIIAVFAILNRVDPQSASASTAVTPKETASAQPRPTAKLALAGLPDIDEEPPALPGPWRVVALKDDANIRMISGTVGLEPFVKTLQSKGVSKRETYRILAAFKKFDAMKRPRKSDEFVVALDRSKGKVAAFELKVSDLDIYQAKENDEGLLVGTKLDMKVATRERATAIRVTGDDLATDLKRGKLRESVISVIDAAFDGRAGVTNMPKNSTLRVILEEKTALGRFAEYDHVVALEYVSSKSDTKPLRLYRFKDGHRYGYFNQDGREPYRGGWRTPCPGAPITSPFNPRRMHPILKKIHPHNGTDYGAPTGTPIHATSFGTIDWIGPRGPAGNLIIIKHPGKIESYYMHMHRFAPGLKKGDKVETFQVIGTVGTTGRSTGPHLHFGMRKNGKWVDSRSFKLDGDRLVTASLRDEFEKVKAEYDKQLDAIALPPPIEEAAPEEAEAPPADDPGKPTTPEVAPTTPREHYDDEEELEPAGSVNDEPIDEAM